MLFEVVVNRAGEVVRIRVAHSLEDDSITSQFKAQVAATRFEASPKGDTMPYRTFFFPMRTKTTVTTYDW